MASRYVTRTGQERWRATWTISGKQRSKGGFATEAEAEVFEGPLRGDDGMGGFSPEAVICRSQSTNVGAWLLLWWNRGFDRWTHETRRSYERAVNELLAPYLQNVTLYGLTSPRVARFRDDALSDGYTNHQVRDAINVLSGALSDAKEAGYVEENRAKGVRRPKKDGAERPINPGTPEDLERIRLAMLNREPYGRFSALDALRNALAVSLGGYGGLRPSERVALKVRHVNFKQRGLWVEDVFAGELRENDNKTHSAARFVDLWPAVMQDIATFIELAGLGPDDFILGDEDGGVSEWTHRNWRERHYNRAKREAVAGLDVVSERRILALTPYDLRHSIVSVIAQAEGRDLREDELADRMGHSIETQHRIYRHVVRAQMRMPRVPVEEQIVLAREKLGIDEAALACIARIGTTRQPTAKLVDLGAERRRRRAA